MNWIDIVFLISGTIITVGFGFIIFCQIQLRDALLARETEKHHMGISPEPLPPLPPAPPHAITSAKDGVRYEVGFIAYGSSTIDPKTGVTTYHDVKLIEVSQMLKEANNE